MKVGDLVKYHRAGRPPKIGIILDIHLGSTHIQYGDTFYYYVNFCDNLMKLRKDHLEIISEIS
jgi:hypothetical protein